MRHPPYVPHTDVAGMSSFEFASLHPKSCGIWWAIPEPTVLKMVDILSSAERSRVSAFRFSADRVCFVAAHSLTRIVAGALLSSPPGALIFNTRCDRCGGSHGKPKLPGTGLEFSLTHTRGRVAVAFSWGVPVGLDIEGFRSFQVDASLMRAALSPEEQELLLALPDAQRGKAFLRYWTRKEALLKAIGCGLAVDMSSLSVSPFDEPPCLERWTAQSELRDPIYLADIDVGGGHLASVATVGRKLTMAVKQVTLTLT